MNNKNKVNSTTSDVSNTPLGNILKKLLSNTVNEARKIPIGRKMSNITGFTTKKGAIHEPTTALRAYSPAKPTSIISPIKNGVDINKRTSTTIPKEQITPSLDTIKDKIKDKKEELSGIASTIAKEEPKYKKFGIENFWDKYAVATKSATHEGGVTGISTQSKTALDKLYNESESYALSQDSPAITKLIQHDKEIATNQGVDVSHIDINNYAERKKYMDTYSNTQKEEIKKWTNYLKAQTAYPDSFKNAILKEVLTKNYDMNTNSLLKRDNKTLRGITSLNPGALSKTFNDYKGNGSLLETYTKNLSAEEINAAKNLEVVKQTGDGKWIKFPSKTNDPNNFEKNQQELSSMVQNTEWCTKNLARQHLEGGDFYIYATEKDGKQYPRIAVRMEGDEVGEVSGIEPSQYIEKEMLGISNDFLNNNVKGGKKWIDANNDSKSAVNLIDKIEKRTFNENDLDEFEHIYSKNMETRYGENTHQKNLKKITRNDDFVKSIIAKKYGIKEDEIYDGDEVTKTQIVKPNSEGKTIATPAPPLSKYKYSLGNVSNGLPNDNRNPKFDACNFIKILGNADFRNTNMTATKALEFVGGDLSLRGSKIQTIDERLKYVGGDLDVNSNITSLNNIEHIGGDAFFHNSNLKYLGKLKTIEGAGFFNSTLIRSLDNLESIGKGADFSSSIVKSLGKLKTIGGDGNFGAGEITDLGNLKSIGGDAYFKYSPLKTLGGLESIGGSAYLSNSSIESLGALKSIGKNAHFNNSNVSDLGNLERIGGDVSFTYAPLKSLGKLSYIGGTADFTPSQIDSLGNLKHIGKNAYFGSNSSITSLGKLEHIGGDAFFQNSNITSLDNLSNIGGFAYLQESKIKSLGKLNNVGKRIIFDNNSPLKAMWDNRKNPHTRLTESRQLPINNLNIMSNTPLGNAILNKQVTSSINKKRYKITNFSNDSVIIPKISTNIIISKYNWEAYETPISESMDNKILEQYKRPSSISNTPLGNFLINSESLGDIISNKIENYAKEYRNLIQK